ncbi:hypothetical protein HMPREF0872_03465 [Veillonella montpellierensis DNF00314]|uniref:Uncharacterized protein n=1 Tax=Veillonella montpellierensis DNF00314 TaxID=1401067 RepID=A0A096CR16_9FIRM|nr:hypothetical protein [Veillonella montpellierensis]KGF47769.1 hypothetical protein HMPREF0872_03465 [Veillonella montpellierensis DNF00314]
MIVKSIQITDNDISIAYQKPSATGLTDVFTIKSKDDPRPELMQSFSQLQTIMKKNFKFLEDFNIPFVVRLFKFKYGAIDDVVDKVSVEGLIEDVNSADTLKFKTNWLSVEYADHTFAISVQDLIDESVKFIMGERAQVSLFTNEE